MTYRRTHPFTQALSAGLLTAVLGTAGFSAQAQSTHAPAAPAQTTPYAHGSGGGRMAHGHADKASDWHKRQHEALKAKLQLTPAQESAWTNFTASMQPMAGQRPDRAARMAQMAEIAKLPTPERIERMRALRAQHMAEMSTQMDKRAEATKAFYAALTPEQQKVFDAETSRMMMAWGQSGYGGHGGGKGHQHGHGHGHPHSHEGGSTGSGRS